MQREQRRKRDADFAICCREALAEADRALAGAEGAFDAAGQGAFNVIKKSRTGHTQLFRAGAKRWSRAIEALRASGRLSAFDPLRTLPESAKLG